MIGPSCLKSHLLPLTQWERRRGEMGRTVRSAHARIQISYPPWIPLCIIEVRPGTFGPLYNISRGKSVDDEYYNQVMIIK